jgi:hypothetical protein
VEGSEIFIHEIGKEEMKCRKRGKGSVFSVAIV